MTCLIPCRQTLHGAFSPDLAPAVTIDPGDTITISTLDVAWGFEQHGEAGAPRGKFAPRESPRDDGPALCGPIAIRGASPGATLEVQILEVVPADWGWTWCGPSPFTKPWRARLGLSDDPPALIRWHLDHAKQVAVSELGLSVAMRPFPGTIGLSPGALGWHDGWTPRRTGGNMDCRELVAGSRLFLPIEAPGGLLSVGDLHAAQGDGEVGGSAIECPAERITLRCLVHSDKPCASPYAKTPAGFVTLGFGPNLDDATAMALSSLLDALTLQWNVTRSKALALASSCVHLRITQIANGTVGAHALLPTEALRSN